MSSLPTLVRGVLVALLWLVSSNCVAAADSDQALARQTWQLLDYIAVDYAEAVRDGRVVNELEYAEMREFSTAVREQLQALPAGPTHGELTAAAAELQAAIEHRAEPAVVGKRASDLANGVLTAYRIDAFPAAPPDLDGAVALYAVHCAACHGAQGNGDGPAAAGLNPPPIAFTDANRAAQRSPFALYQVISQGLKGTSMASFSQLSEADRWALAFHIGGMAYSADDRARGEKLWGDDPASRQSIPTLHALSSSSEVELAKTLGDTRAKAITAHLRASPAAVVQQKPVEGLGLARSLLGDSVAAYRNGDAAEARRLALASYLDGIEPVEPMLASRDRALLHELESAMAVLREQIGDRAPVDDVANQANTISALLDRADTELNSSQNDAATAFLGSFTILLREGLEAMLIVIGMIAFLRKAERQDALPYVHAGWVGALIAGAITWMIATYLIGISGANREITEGLSALFAAAVLLSVGIWMHRKSLAGRWQHYLQEKMAAALTRRSAMFLFLLAFVAVYREVFETILFFAAMWSERNGSAIIGGLVAGSVSLAVVAFWLLRFSKRLPIAQFFRISSIFIAVLAVVLVGKGTAALQEAGWVTQGVLAIPRVEWLGVYPTWQSLLAQVVVAVAALIGFATNIRSGRVMQKAAH